MKLHNITKNLSSMTDEELRAHVSHIRHNKYTARPAKAKHEADVEKIAKRRGNVKVNKMLSSMSDSERQQLLLLLEGGSNE